MAEPMDPPPSEDPPAVPTSNVPRQEISDPFGEEGFMMGGSIGDGALPEDVHHQQQLHTHPPAPPTTPGSRTQPTPANTPFSGVRQIAITQNMHAPHIPQLQQQQMQQQQMSVPVPVSQPTRGGGSYATRSAAMMEHHQQQPQMQPSIVVSTTPQQQQPNQFQASPAASAMGSSSMMTSPYRPNPASSTMSSPAATGGASYAQRSQVGLQQQQQPQMQVQPNPQSAISPPQQGIMSRYAQDVVHQQQTRPYIPQQQQYQQQQTNMAHPTGGGSYSQRSAAMVQQPIVQQQQPQQQQQQQYGMQPGMQQQQLSQPNTMHGGNNQASMMQSSGMMQQSQQQPQSQYGVQQQPGMQQPGMIPQQHQQAQQQRQQFGMASQQPQPVPPHLVGQESPAEQAQQSRLLMDATRKVQEHAYYMKQSMERHDLPNILDRAASMVGELGEHAHAHHSTASGQGGHSGPSGPGIVRPSLNPKNYYELHLRALDDLPALEEYLKSLASQGKGLPGNAAGSNGIEGSGMNVDVTASPASTNPYTMRALYDIVQYCPNVLSRLYLQICAASALISSKEVGAKWVMLDIMEAVKCVQNPVRGLFLRHYLLQAFRDKLPDTPPQSAANAGVASEDQKLPSSGEDVMDPGTVQDSYEFILANFMEMNKLWVRIQNLPGDGKSREIRRRRERERNELRLLVGTNLVRLSQLECVTSSIYGGTILPKILEHIVVCNDPLAQAYLMDCITQVFPDEFHFETMPILLRVCPKLRHKVNIRTILQSLMNRLANYLADEELLDEKDTNDVKLTLAKDSFRMFDECVQNVYNARGPKLTSKEVIRLQTALLSFTMKCHKGDIDQVVRSLGACVQGLNQARTLYTVLPDGNMATTITNVPLDEASTKELEKLLAIPMDSLALGVLELDHFSDLISFLPWSDRRQVALTLLEAISNAGASPKGMREIEELFEVISPVIRDDPQQPTQPQSNDPTGRTTQLMAGLGIGNGNNPQMFDNFASQEALGQSSEIRAQNALVCKLIHLLNNDNTDAVFEMLTVAKQYLSAGGTKRTSQTYVALVFKSLKLAKRIVKEERARASGKKENNTISGVKDAAATNDEEANEADEPKQDEDVKGDEDKEGSSTPVEPQATDEEISKDPTADEGTNESEQNVTADDASDSKKNEKAVTARTVFVFIQQTISALGSTSPEVAIKLYHEAAQFANSLVDAGYPTSKEDFSPIAQELLAQSCALYEEKQGDSKYQHRCIVSMIGTLIACKCLEKADYEKLIMKTATYAAKTLRKEDQCELVTLCSHLFYSIGGGGKVHYGNSQRCLECLQRALKLADACTSLNPSNIGLFVDLLEQYIFFFGKGNPSISPKYITGLIALIKEHTANVNANTAAVYQAKMQFAETVRYVKTMKEGKDTAQTFASIELGDL